MSPTSYEVVICGAGIAGVSLAHRLAVHHGVRDVVLVDDGAPLSLTSDKSTEAYRNWWPGPDDAMVRLMNRSVDLLEELAASCDNRFRLNRRGYLWATANPKRADAYRRQGELAQVQGAGEMRIHTGRLSDPDYLPHRAGGWADAPDGADLILDTAMLRTLFPYLTHKIEAVLHTRRCGWFDGQQLGMVQLERAREAGVTLVAGRVVGIETAGGRVTGVRVAETGGSERKITTGRLVLAAGPGLAAAARLLGLELPVFSELHCKAWMEDGLGKIPRDAPLMIWEDAQRLPWSSEERELLACDDATRFLTDEMPAGVHLRPEGSGGSRGMLILWPFHAEPVPETFPIEPPPSYAEICLRGMAAMVPGLAAYFEQPPRPFVDGGYYTKTRDNRPLAGPLPVEGAFVHGALSGFGLMASQGTAELVALHLTGESLPDYARAFRLERFDDPTYLALLDAWGDGGQL